MISRTLASIVAGSVGGAFGVLVSFPLDTVKTRTQVMKGLPLCCKKDEDACANNSMLQAINIIYQTDGIGGFYSGCRSMMMGQAVIKAIAFTVNAMALGALMPYSDYLPPAVAMLTAAFTAGFVASFVVAPVERIKVRMQANGKMYTNGFECLRSIVAIEGWTGLLHRGLLVTMMREIPSDGVYFALYGYLSQSQLVDHFGASSPLIFGAIAGCASWCPVYPIDSVKTIVQNTEGGSSMCPRKVASDIYKKGGLSSFYVGFPAKLMRAAVFHSMTFMTYEMVLNALGNSS